MALEIIKVCGITNAADAIFAAEHGATALGFIFYPGSPRCIRVEEAAMITAVVKKRVLRVGVFVNEAPEQIGHVVNAARLDVAQLHGDESPGVCAQVRGVRIWKAFRLDDRFDPDIAAAYDCDAYLLDGSREGVYGGSGETFPWRFVGDVKKHGRVIVSGGLDDSNVSSAIRSVNPYGVDASSKLESKPGVKDHEKVRRYLEAARSMMMEPEKE